MEQSELITVWQYLDKGHCAFKSTSTSPERRRCNHLFTVTGGHQFSECPLIQPKFYAFQQQESLVYLIEKKPDAPPAAMWDFTELPAEREKARKIVEKKIKEVSENLKEAIWRKFEQQYDVVDIIKASEELTETEDEDLEES
jgi:hypothetical protein